MQVKEALSVHKETEVIYQFFSEIYARSIYPKRHQDSVRLSLSLFVPSTPQCIVFSPIHSVALCALLCKNLSLTLHILDAP